MAYIDHVDNAEGAEELGRAIASEWPQAVEILPCQVSVLIMLRSLV
ncbi:MAG: hypothetical protein ACLT5H_09625 [Collinsella stercoris]